MLSSPPSGELLSGMWAGERLSRERLSSDAVSDEASTPSEMDRGGGGGGVGSG